MEEAREQFWESYASGKLFAQRQVRAERGRRGGGGAATRLEDVAARGGNVPGERREHTSRAGLGCLAGLLRLLPGTHSLPSAG